MAKVVFFDPAGDPSRQIELAEILDLLDTKDESYWNDPNGSGGASLYYYDHSSDDTCSSYVDFTMKNGYGYKLFFVENNPKARNLFYAVGSDDYDSHVWVNWDAGEKRMAKALFVSSDDFREAIQHFFRTGGRSDRIRWLRPNEIPWKQFEAYR